MHWMHWTLQWIFKSHWRAPKCLEPHGQTHCLLQLSRDQRSPHTCRERATSACWNRMGLPHEEHSADTDTKQPQFESWRNTTKRKKKKETTKKMKLTPDRRSSDSTSVLRSRDFVDTQPRDRSILL